MSLWPGGTGVRTTASASPVQLALVRDLGRPLQIGEVLPAAVVDTVAEQIGLDPVIFKDSAT